MKQKNQETIKKETLEKITPNTKEPETNKPEINLKTIKILSILLIVFFGIFIILNEYTLTTGEKVYLKTVPVDPRDLLRGDYVILRYEIEQDSSINYLIENKELKLGDIFYINLNIDENQIGNFESVTLKNKPNKLSLKATIETDSGNFNIGIGKYFIPEDKGRQLEVLRNKNLTMLVSIDKFGSTKIINPYYNGEVFQFE
jgi:uncharacterized membrane-anchored protein